ncbi:hypothetical protein QP743_00040 [Sphingomonas zeae]|nr:hypothetical protein [Sphingomonas zeae]
MRATILVPGGWRTAGGERLAGAARLLLGRCGGGLTLSISGIVLGRRRLRRAARNRT